MKKILFLLAMVAFLYSCKSEKDKAEEIIRNFMFESLLDYDSYQPISTEISAGGYFAKHKFRCKTAGGISSIHHWEFTLDYDNKCVKYYKDDDGDIQFP